MAFDRRYKRNQGQKASEYYSGRAYGLAAMAPDDEEEWEKYSIELCALIGELIGQISKLEKRTVRQNKNKNCFENE